MIAVDTNLLVYAHRRDSPFHEISRELVRQLAEGSAVWALPWPCVHEVLANITNARIYKKPTPLERALDQVAQWLGSPSVRLLAEDPEYWSTLSKVLAASKVTGARVHDARIAALCLRHGVAELWTADRDFGRFAPLRVRNPLVP